MNLILRGVVYLAVIAVVTVVGVVVLLLIFDGIGSRVGCVVLDGGEFFRTTGAGWQSWCDPAGPEGWYALPSIGSVFGSGAPPG